MRTDRPWLIVLTVVLTCYLATRIFGIGAVRATQEASLLRFYEKQKAFYAEHKAELAENVFWKPMLRHHDGFPSWEKYRLWKGREESNRHLAVFPFLVLSCREGAVPGNGFGMNELYIWYVFGAHQVAGKMKWVE